MDSRTKERVEQWDSRPFTDGHGELSDLADDGFSGAVAAGGAWLFMLNGRIVGVVDGDVDALEDASGTVYAAPDPALPLLCSMIELGGETRAKYYTNETPLTEVDRTLQDGSFTGYIELSERVLSGDYYAVYYGGRRMAAAYIGNADRLLTGDEAFERAVEEVGIYEVIDVDLEVTDVPGSNGAAPPESTGPGTAPQPTADGDADGTPATDTEPASEATPTADGESTVVDPAAESAPEATERADADDHAAEPSPAEPADATPSNEADDPPADDATEADDPPMPEEAATAGTQSEVAADNSSATTTGELEAAAEELSESEVPWASEDESDEPDRTSAEASGVSPASTPPEGSGEHQERLEREAQWRETRNIPSIDPERTADSVTAAGAPRRRASAGSQSITRPTPEPEEATADDESAGANERHEESRRSEGALESDMLEREDTIDQLTQRVETLERRRDDLRERAAELETERDRVRAENQELTATVERLRRKISELEEARGGSTESTDDERGGKTQLSPARALSETNLFLRYDSKSRPTLERAHEGAADREEVAENLRLEHHTGFDAAAVSVVGEPYEEFLSGSIEYQFVDWLTETLLYEIRDTGRADGLADLYDSIPYIDRIELDASISLADDDTEDVPDTVRFDVVAFDKMGDPLIVANINDSREPASRQMLVEMEEAASAVKANYPGLGAAMVLTSSYFEPGALEVTEQATSGGFLSRSSKLSYVTLSRKQGGYHLCLVEARSGGFHVTVPEL